MLRSPLIQQTIDHECVKFDAIVMIVTVGINGISQVTVACSRLRSTTE